MVYRLETEGVPRDERDEECCGQLLEKCASVHRPGLPLRAELTIPSKASTPGRTWRVKLRHEVQPAKVESRAGGCCSRAGHAVNKGNIGNSHATPVAYRASRLVTIFRAAWIS